MRPNVVSEAGLHTRLGQWWQGIPFFTSAVIIACGTIYLVCLLVGYDSFLEICFLPSAIISHFQVYRIYTSIVFHGSLLHVMFNMLAFSPLGSELERIMGSVRFLYMTLLLATSNALFHILIASMVAHNPIHPEDYLMNECAIGFSGILFSMIVIETSLSGAQYRSVFGLFNIPAKWYSVILLVAIQLLMTNVSLLGHLCGIVSGFAYTYGLFNFLIPGTSFYSAIEGYSWLSTCVRRPKFILCTGGNPSAYLPTHSSQNTTSSGLISGNLWSNLSSLMPQNDTSSQSTHDSQRFPGRGRTLNTGLRSSVPIADSDSGLQARLLDGNSPRLSEVATNVSGQERLNGSQPAVYSATTVPTHLQGSVVTDQQVEQLVSMGFERTQVEVALAAADGNPSVAAEILMSQQG